MIKNPYWNIGKMSQILIKFYYILETISDPVNLEAGRQVTKKKPIVAIKSGRSEAGAKAASSHTGSLAGADLAADSFLKQSGVIRANSVLEMFEVALVLKTVQSQKAIK